MKDNIINCMQSSSINLDETIVLGKIKKEKKKQSLKQRAPLIELN